MPLALSKTKYFAKKEIAPFNPIMEGASRDNINQDLQRNNFDLRSQVKV